MTNHINTPAGSGAWPTKSYDSDKLPKSGAGSARSCGTPGAAPLDSGIQMIRIDDLCRILQISRSTVYRRCKSGDLKLWKLGPRVTVFFVAEVEAYIRACGGDK